MKKLLLSVSIILLFLNNVSGVENLNRGVIALPIGSGKIYVGWRLLKDDPKEIVFNIYRSEGAEGSYVKVNKSPIVESTNFVDDGLLEGKAYFYQVVPVLEGEERLASRPFKLWASGVRKNYINIGLKGSYAFHKCAIADLDGDGEYDYVIKQPFFNADPYLAPGYWKPSTTTYSLEAYRSDGTFLWRHDMGWAIESGVWYSPYLVYDLDGDGKAEVYTKYGEGDPRNEEGRVFTGPEYLARLNGMTGKLEMKIPWHSREGFKESRGESEEEKGYNRSSRNFLAVAFLDGKRPSLIMQRGTYGIIKMSALDSNLKLIWNWDSTMEVRRFSGQGSHGFISADIDGDNRDELIYGAACVDDNGRGLWTQEKGHPDVCYVGDIDPFHPGLEIFFGFETSQKKNGLCLVDGKTGEVLWGYDEPTVHVHSQGMVADIFPDWPGLECFGGEKDGSKQWLFDSKGGLISKSSFGGRAPRAVRWDEDIQRELILDHGRAENGNRRSAILSKGIQKNDTHILSVIEGHIIGIADVFGDWREEIITSLNGRLHIYTTTIPAKTRIPCLMQDRLYRNYVSVSSVGYWNPPLLSENFTRHFQKIPTLPSSYGLLRNYPNPFNPGTWISYELPKVSDISLTIYNLQGQQVRMLLLGQQQAGFYRVAWDGTDTSGRSVSSGIYLVRMVAGSFSDVGKMVLLK